VGAQSKPRGGIIEGINVTPLVDITLVLLVIFIVTAKITVAPAVPLDLPTASSHEAVQTVFAVSLTADGTLYVDGSVCADEALTARARTAREQDAELRAVIQADGGVPHRRVIAVLDALTAAGVERVAFGAQPAEEHAP
jgi:biopolymer transport protein ExbD